MAVTDLSMRYRQGPDRSSTKRGWAVHHTAGPEDFKDVTAEIEHLDWLDRFHREKRGFQVGIGYHTCIFKSGNVYRVGQQNTQRAHIEGLNHIYDGMCFVGTFSGQHAPSERALAAGREMISATAMSLMGGHGTLALSGAGTTCPGGWNLDLLLPRTPTKPPPATSATRMKVAMDVWLRKTPLVPHDVQVQDGKMYDRYIVRKPRA